MKDDKIDQLRIFSFFFFPPLLYNKAERLMVGINERSSSRVCFTRGNNSN